MWVIRDGQRTRGTGCYEVEREAAETQLARYIEANPPLPPPELPPPNTVPKVQPTFVYVIGPRYRHPVKIGISASPQLRMASLQTGHHRSLVMLAQVPGSALEERALHRLFKRDHINGEWFERSTEIETFIELIERRGLPLHLAVKWITDDRADVRRQHRAVVIKANGKERDDERHDH
jgi:hypothetical protein